MNAARSPRRTAKLLSITPSSARVHALDEIDQLVRSGDVWVLNDAATFPASLFGQTESGSAIEIRLLPRRPGKTKWSAITFGAGDWKTKTEFRPSPPELRVGEILRFDDLAGIVRSVSPHFPRKVEIEFRNSDELTWESIYRLGHPIQYAYQLAPLDLWSVQTPHASRPWASEMPSAGRPLNWEILKRMTRAGAEIHSLTHATGISSTGDPEFDAILPLPEFFELPQATVEAVIRAKRRGSRIVAVGTSVVRALEGSARLTGVPIPGLGETDLKIDPGYQRKIVDAIFTGIHSPGESHFELLQSFLPREVFYAAEKIGTAEGLLSHEFGDASFVEGSPSLSL